MINIDIIKKRHSVRSYLDKPLEGEAIRKLQQAIEECNQESGLHIQLVSNEPKAFDGFMAHYGKFKGVNNYIALIGPRGKDLEETCGYYGEKLVLTAEELGLNTCWVYMTYRKIKDAFVVGDNEKLVCVIALGYGAVPGKPHSSKTLEDVVLVNGDMPAWFVNGVQMALLAPTAMNQQKFEFILDGDTVLATAGFGVCTKIDLGIVKYHFELGAGKENFRWK
mgnify:FL=1